MRNIIIKYGLAIFLIILESCDTAVSVNAEFRERYVLTSILDCEKNTQLVFLSKTYDNTLVGKDPNINSIFVKNAEVKMWYKYDVYDFRDTLIENLNGEEIECYVANGLKPEGDNIVEIEALLPNKLLLSSQTYIPKVNKIRIEGTNAGDISDQSVEDIYINWTNIGEYIYDPKIFIVYYNLTDSLSEPKFEEVPIDFVVNDNDTTVISPTPSNNTIILFKETSLRNSLLRISENDPAKAHYSIVNLQLRLKIYDNNLSAYYSSTHQFLDHFSISLDRKLYSNIDGGHGIFGSFNSIYLSVGLDKDYLSSFGYKYAK